jgi:hypothetical protein
VHRGVHDVHHVLDLVGGHHLGAGAELVVRLRRAGPAGVLRLRAGRARVAAGVLRLPGPVGGAAAVALREVCVCVCVWVGGGGGGVQAGVCGWAACWASHVPAPPALGTLPIPAR